MTLRTATFNLANSSVTPDGRRRAAGGGIRWRLTGADTDATVAAELMQRLVWDHDTHIVALTEVDVNCRRSGSVDQPKLLASVLGAGWRSVFVPALELDGGHHGVALLLHPDIQLVDGSVQEWHQSGDPTPLTGRGLYEDVAGVFVRVRVPADGSTAADSVVVSVACARTLWGLVGADQVAALADGFADYAADANALLLGDLNTFDMAGGRKPATDATMETHHRAVLAWTAAGFSDAGPARYTFPLPGPTRRLDYTLVKAASDGGAVLSLTVAGRVSGDGWSDHDGLRHEWVLAPPPPPPPPRPPRRRGDDAGVAVAGVMEAFDWTRHFGAGIDTAGVAAARHTRFSHRQRRRLLRFMAARGVTDYVYSPARRRDDDTFAAASAVTAEDAVQWRRTFALADGLGLRLVWGVAPTAAADAAWPNSWTPDGGGEADPPATGLTDSVAAGVAAARADMEAEALLAAYARAPDGSMVQPSPTRCPTKWVTIARRVEVTVATVASLGCRAFVVLLGDDSPLPRPRRRPARVAAVAASHAAMATRLLCGQHGHLFVGVRPAEFDDPAAGAAAAGAGSGGDGDAAVSPRVAAALDAVLPDGVPFVTRVAAAAPAVVPALASGRRVVVWDSRTLPPAAASRHVKAQSTPLAGRWLYATPLPADVRDSVRNPAVAAHWVALTFPAVFNAGVVMALADAVADPPPTPAPHLQRLAEAWCDLVVAAAVGPDAEPGALPAARTARAGTDWTVDTSSAAACAALCRRPSPLVDVLLAALAGRDGARRVAGGEWHDAALRHAGAIRWLAAVEPALHAVMVGTVLVRRRTDAPAQAHALVPALPTDMVPWRVLHVSHAERAVGAGRPLRRMRVCLAASDKGWRDRLTVRVPAAPMPEVGAGEWWTLHDTFAHNKHRFRVGRQARPPAADSLWHLQFVFWAWPAAMGATPADGDAGASAGAGAGASGGVAMCDASATTAPASTVDDSALAAVPWLKRYLVVRCRDAEGAEAWGIVEAGTATVDDAWEVVDAFWGA